MSSRYEELFCKDGLLSDLKQELSIDKSRFLLAL